MKRKILILLAAVLTVGVCVVGYTQSSRSSKSTATSQESSRELQREARHKEREERRAQRLAEYEHFLDSIVLARNFQFNPQSMQQQPAGSTRILNNPNYLLTIWGSEVDVCLPFIKGVTPPYYPVLLNYTLPSVMQYVTEQTHEGWLVTFSSTLFSATTYQFSLEIYSSSGSATLTISTPWYPDVQYGGSITSIN
jgi:hypothetical protein